MNDGISKAVVSTKRRRISEETANLLTHGVGLVLSIVGSSTLVCVALSRGNFWQTVGCSVYAGTLVALYASSTLSHSFQRPRARHFFRVADQVCIFLLIAGNYTPFAVAYLLEGWWWTLSVVIWGLALVGIIFKIFFSYLENVTVWAYILLGWLAIIGIQPIMARLPSMGLAWMLAGGVFYTIGTLFLARDEKAPYYHAIWHLFVIAGSACHYIAVMFFVVA